MHFPRFSPLLFLLVPHLFGASLSLNDVAEQYLSQGYDIQIAAQEADKSKSDLISAQRRPNPTLMGEYQYMDIRNHLNDVSPAATALLTLHLDHPIEMGNKRDRRIETANANIDYQYSLLDETKRESLFGLIDIFYQVQADETNLANALENRNDFNKILTIAQAKFDHGFLSELDLQKLKLQRIDYDKEVQLYHSALASDKEALAFLLSLKAEQIDLASISSPDKLSSTLDDLIRNAQLKRPDCIAAQRYIKLSDTALQLEKANAVPDITVGGEYEAYGPNYKPLIGISAMMPLPVYDQNRGSIERARITSLQAATQQTKILEQAASQVRQSYTQLQSQQNIYESIQTGFESAKLIKEKQEKIFALKEMSILELTDAQKSYREYQKNLTQVLIDLNIATAHLKLNSGLSLTETKGY